MELERDANPGREPKISSTHLSGISSRNFGAFKMSAAPVISVAIHSILLLSNCGIVEGLEAESRPPLKTANAGS